MDSARVKLNKSQPRSSRRTLNLRRRPAHLGNDRGRHLYRLQNSAQGCELRVWTDAHVAAGSWSVPVRLLYLILIRVFGWLMLLSGSQGQD
jgi:hypothetical protein